MSKNDYTGIADKYGSTEIISTGFLAFRDIIKFIPKSIANDALAMDFGCGTGRAARIMEDLGLNTIGIDISMAMLSIAKEKGSKRLLCVEPLSLPFRSDSFSLIVSTLVLFEMDSLDYMRDVLIELNRVLCDGGTAIFVTGSEHMYSHKWLSIETLNDKRRPLVSGEKVQVILNKNITLTDTFWKNTDYQAVFKKCTCNRPSIN